MKFKQTLISMLVSTILILAGFLIFWTLCDFPSNRANGFSELNVMFTLMGLSAAVIAISSAAKSVSRLTEQPNLKLIGPENIVQNVLNSPDTSRFRASPTLDLTLENLSGQMIEIVDIVLLAKVVSKANPYGSEAIRIVPADKVHPMLKELDLPLREQSDTPAWYLEWNKEKDSDSKFRLSDPFVLNGGSDIALPGIWLEEKNHPKAINTADLESLGVILEMIVRTNRGSQQINFEAPVTIHLVNIDFRDSETEK